MLTTVYSGGNTREVLVAGEGPELGGTEVDVLLPLHAAVPRLAQCPDGEGEDEQKAAIDADELHRVAGGDADAPRRLGALLAVVGFRPRGVDVQRHVRERGAAVSEHAADQHATVTVHPAQEPAADGHGGIRLQHCSVMSLPLPSRTFTCLNSHLSDSDGPGPSESSTQSSNATSRAELGHGERALAAAAQDADGLPGERGVGSSDRDGGWTALAL
ncbi:hypothetical protein ZWY2020_052793 [Hordeum vulgare]|nr:hypothetical protein ZWY2020_052793 [Hordeum vulgare]